MKRIKFEWLVKAQNAFMRMFEAEDEEYPDYRKVRANERAMDYWIGKITQDKEEYGKIYHIISSGSFDTRDYSFKSMCDRLEEIGFEVADNEEH